ncbi:MAG: hypothetical protein ACRDHV_01195 [Actinomycetota bacterium]
MTSRPTPRASSAATIHPAIPGKPPGPRPGRHTADTRYLIPKYTGLRLDLDRYLRYYNTDRAHTGRWTKGRTPEQVLGKVKMWQR